MRVLDFMFFDRKVGKLPKVRFRVSWSFGRNKEIGGVGDASWLFFEGWKVLFCGIPGNINKGRSSNIYNSKTLENACTKHPCSRDQVHALQRQRLKGDPGPQEDSSRRPHNLPPPEEHHYRLVLSGPLHPAVQQKHPLPRNRSPRQIAHPQNAPSRLKTLTDRSGYPSAGDQIQ